MRAFLRDADTAAVRVSRIHAEPVHAGARTSQSSHPVYSPTSALVQPRGSGHHARCVWIPVPLEYLEYIIHTDDGRIAIAIAKSYSCVLKYYR